jgi:bacillithiol biosynthesis deacetylase BshB1
LQLDLLAFGPHPDDIEIGLGATVALHTARGLKVGLCDLTRGEMGSNGTPEERMVEAEEARKVLGAVWRGNLNLPDRAIESSPEHVRRAVETIRRWRPRVLAVPYWEDRHPDHPMASRLLSEAAFNAGLRRFQAAGDPWRADWVCYYFINDAVPPSFVIDVSEHYYTKLRALACYVSQFQPSTGDPVRTRLTEPTFRQLVESRDAQFGALAGVRFAEGILVKEPVVRADLMK